MTYDYELTLIGETSYTKDSIGNQIPEEAETVILCGLKSVGRSEFYSAAVAGLKPELMIVVHNYEYNGEKKVEFEGVRYSVIRSYSVNIEELELTCERVTVDG